MAFKMKIYDQSVAFYVPNLDKSLYGVFREPRRGGGDALSNVSAWTVLLRLSEGLLVEVCASSVSDCSRSLKFPALPYYKILLQNLIR